jgi:hypothetical protein
LWSITQRRVDHDRQLEFLGELDLRPQVFVFRRGLLVIAELAHGDDAVLQRETRQDFHHGFGQRLVVGLLRVEPDRAIVADAELAGAETLEARDQGQVVAIGLGAGARLTEPEGRLDHGDDAGAGHGLVIVGGARDHMGVRVDDHGAGAQRDAAPPSGSPLSLPLS